MKQVRFNYSDKYVSQSIYIGQADDITEARQVVLNSLDESLTSYKDAIPYGIFFFGMKEM